MLSAEVLDQCGAHVELDPMQGGAVRMVLHSPEHPLDVESYPSIDCALRSVNDALHIDQINGWPRNDWRPFREGAG